MPANTKKHILMKPLVCADENGRPVEHPRGSEVELDAERAQTLGDAGYLWQEGMDRPAKPGGSGDKPTGARSRRGSARGAPAEGEGGSPGDQPPGSDDED